MSRREPEQPRYYVGLTRGPNFDFLRKRGFLTFYPSMDDYVFLEQKPEHDKLLRKQTELCVSFMRHRGKYVLITKAEVEKMAGETINLLNVGSKVKAIQGVAAGLDGEILELRGTKVFCTFQGFNRTYEVEVDTQDLVRADTPVDNAT